MSTLLEARDRIISVYKQYSSIFIMVLRFAAVFLSMVFINGRIGYQETLTSPLLSAIIALVCTLIPTGAVIAILAVVIIVQLYTLSLEAAVVGLILFLLMFLLYFRFQPKDGILFVLAPALSMLGVPQVLPVAGGLLFSATSGITAALGMVVVSFIGFVSENAATIGATAEEGDTIARFRFVIDGLLQNKAMIVMVISMAASAALVYVLRRLVIRYSWHIASAAGAVLQIIILLIGDMIYSTNINIAGAFGGCILAALVGVVITFFAFNLDYSRVEDTQFEDDDYYYYVRAVPKNSYIAPRRTVKQINTSRRLPRREEEGFEDYAPYPEEDNRER